ncbi:Uncharacterised protein [Streptococcus pneumoniae]|nr:Uncharacterised protein [Streptococcus pneumoniae]
MAAYGQSADVPVRTKSEGISVTASPWLINTVCSSGVDSKRADGVCVRVD